MELTLAFHSNLDRDISAANLRNEPEIVRRLSFGLDKGTMLMESWVLRSGGTMLESSGVDGSFKIPAEHLEDLLDVLRQFQEATEASVACGVGSELVEAAVALKVARKRGGSPSVVLYTPDVAAEAQDEDEDDLDPILEEEAESLEGEMQKAQFGEDDLHPQRGEATKISQGDMRPSAAQPSAPSPLSPPAAPEQGDDEQNQGGGDPQQGGDLIQAVGQVLMDVKKQLPTLEGLKESKPEAYQSILAMTQALVALAQQLTGGGQPQPPGAPVQKSESDDDGKFETDMNRAVHAGCEIEAKEHPSFNRFQILRIVKDHLAEDPNYYSKEKTEVEPHEEAPAEDKLDKMRLPEQKPPPAHHHLNLPVGSVRDQRVKIVHADGHEGWVQVKAGQILSEDGHAISSRNPGGR